MLNWYFDFISPFAYLQQEVMDRVPGRCQYRPVLLAGLLAHWGQKGPAEITPKRVFTYQHVSWLAKKAGIPFRFPPAHPFNPLPALRLALALECEPAAVRRIFRYIWRDGKSLDDGEALAGLAAELGVQDLKSAISSPAVKTRLRENGEAAIAAGIFGVPTFEHNGTLFWGFDATEMLLEYLAGDPFFHSLEFLSLAEKPIAASRIP